MSVPVQVSVFAETFFLCACRSWPPCNLFLFSLFTSLSFSTILFDLPKYGIEALLKLSELNDEFLILKILNGI